MSSPEQTGPDDATNNSDVESKTDNDLENKEPEVRPDKRPTQQVYKFAEGGRKAWLVVLGCWCTSFASFGYINSFGVYETYYLQTYLSNYSPSTVAWIGSVQTFLLISSTIVSGPVIDRYGAMVLIWPFSLLLVIAMMLISVCREFYQFLLCQGILLGVSCGMIFPAAMTVVGQYFYKKRAMAMAFASTGSPIGGIIFPVIMTNSLHRSGIGFGWGQRICGFLTLVLLSIAAVTIRPTGMRRDTKILLLEPFRKPTYSLQIAGQFMAILGLWTPNFYLANYGLEHGMSPELANYLFALINGGSLIGRLLSGVAALHLGQFNIMTVGIYCCAILSFCWLAIKSSGALIALALLYGASSGTVVALMMPTLAHTADHPSKIGTYIGQATFLIGFAAFAGTPITGALIHQHVGFTGGITFSAAAIMAGAIIYTFARITINRKVLVA